MVPEFIEGLLSALKDEVYPRPELGSKAAALETDEDDGLWSLKISVERAKPFYATGTDKTATPKK